MRLSRAMLDAIRVESNIHSVDEDIVSLRNRR